MIRLNVMGYFRLSENNSLYDLIALNRLQYLPIARDVSLLNNHNVMGYIIFFFYLSAPTPRSKSYRQQHNPFVSRVQTLWVQLLCNRGD